ncbi:DUF202 domain-containing protein [Vibrio navarrensis]|nr:DUF202 domain-containing protein [Vibrio navarrensis]
MRQKWADEGDTPDYRFSLANERTFLAWIRTALAFLAAAIGLDQLAPNLVEPPIRVGISAALCAVAAYFSFVSYVRWRKNEIAMRHQRPLTYTKHLTGISVIMLLLGVTLGIIVVI